MNTHTYNGWTNRETWLVNLHFGDSTDYINEMAHDVRGDVDEMAEAIKNMVYDFVEEQTMNIFINDMMNLSSVDWQELAEAWLSDYESDDNE